MDAMRRMRAVAAGAGVAMAVVLMGCGADRPAKRVVDIQGFVFQPAVLEASVGDTVEWINHDVVPHAVAATAGGEWASGSIATNASWEMVVKGAGRVEYLCPFHPTMKGTLVVR